MKKIILFAFICSISYTSIAQKYSILVGGNFEINSKKDDIIANNPFGGGTQVTKQSDFNFSPIIGYQVSNNFTLGVISSFKTIKFEGKVVYPYQTPAMQESIQEISETTFGAFVRYSKTISNTFSIYGQVEALSGNSKNYSKQVNTGFGPPNIQETTTKGTTTNINLFPAIFINVKNNFGINLNFGGLSYSKSKIKTLAGSASNFNFNFGKVINFGISKNFSTKFNKKKKK